MLLPSFSTLVTPEDEEGEKGRKREKEVVPLPPPVATMSIWRPLTVEEMYLEDFVVKGLFLPKVVAHWRAPPVEHEELQPEADEIVSFIAFHEHSLWYPAHPVLLSLLNEWELELQHLNPNEVLHNAGFVMLYECFLKIDPHANLFRAFFHGRGLTVKGDQELAPVGGFGLQKKPRPSGDYPAYTPADSNRGWHEEWFYIRNLAETPFSAFTGAPSLRRTVGDGGQSPWRRAVCGFSRLRCGSTSRRRVSMWCIFSAPCTTAVSSHWP
jgi:hypothetical protein